MMNTSMNLHHCTDMYVESHSPDISNALTLCFEAPDGSFTLTAFDMPPELTAKILAVFPARRVDPPKKEAAL